MSTSLSSATWSTIADLSLVTISARQSIRNISTGLRINRAADGPAQLISSVNLRATLAFLDGQIAGLQRANEAASTADAALSEVSGLLAEANSLEVQLANGNALGSEEKAAIQGQIDSILQAVDRIGSTTSFNGQNLLDGSMTLRVGRESLDLAAISSMDLGNMSIDGQSRRLMDVRAGGLLEDDHANAQLLIDEAINDIAVERARIGNFQTNTVETRTNSFGVAIEQLTAAEAAGTGVNIAAEMANLARTGILTAMSMGALSIANENQRVVLSLLHD